MSLASVPILSAVKEIILGESGAVRIVAPGTFQYGKHFGLNDDELARKALVLPIFDVNIQTASPSPTTTGVFSSFRVYVVRLTVSVAYWLSSEVLDDSRELARATALDDADRILQALTYPGNLAQTSAAVETNLVSACLQSDGGAAITREDPDQNLLITTMTFSGLVKVVQAVA